MLKGKDRYFSAIGPGFKPRDEMELCQSLWLGDDDFGDTFIEEKHGLDIKQKCLRQEEVSTLHEFLKDGIQTIKKIPFIGLRGYQIGDQIWIYRDRRTNPGNPVAAIKPDAHVAVCVGEECGEKKVVHVEKDVDVSKES